MAINNAKHIVNEIDGIRCTIVETGITIDRVAFLRELLENNNLEVKEIVEPAASQGDEPKYTLGVTDLVFNPVFAIYECRLKTRDGKYVTPGYWKQECTECDPRYWIKRKVVKKTTID
jgi:hypothetical protein